MLNSLNLSRIIHKKEKKEPLENQSKYCVKSGHIVVSPNELVESEKVKKQLEALRKHFATKEN